VIVLEGLAATVEGVAVRFDRDPEVAPEEVDLAAGNRDIDLGRGEIVPTAEPQEDLLELAAGLLAARLQPGAQALDLRLADHPPHLRRRGERLQVGDRSRRVRHRDLASLGDHLGGEGRTAMNPNVLPRLPAGHAG
jgi:hypothetical protein